MTKYDFELEDLATIIGSAVIIILLGAIYAGLLGGITYLCCAGLAYIFDATLPDGFLLVVMFMAILQTVWKFYKEVKS